MCKIGTFQRNLSTIFLNLLNIYLFSKIFQKIKIVILRWNILQYLTKKLRQYFNCNKILEIFLTCICNILCYVGRLYTGCFNSITSASSKNFCVSTAWYAVVLSWCIKNQESKDEQETKFSKSWGKKIFVYHLRGASPVNGSKNRYFFYHYSIAYAFRNMHVKFQAGIRKIVGVMNFFVTSCSTSGFWRAD